MTPAPWEALNEPFTAPGPAPIQEAGMTEHKMGLGGEQFRPDKDEVWWDNVRLQSLRSPIGFLSDYPGSIFRWAEDRQAENQSWEAGDQKMSPEDVKRLYGIQVDGPIYQSQAVIRAQNQARERELQAWMSRGPEQSMGDSLTAMAMSGLDPLNLALGAAIGGQRLTARLGGNILGNLLADIPNYRVRRGLGEEVDLGETIKGSVAGGVLGTGLHYGIVGVAKVAAPIVRRMPEAFQRKVLRSVVAEHESGVRPDTSPATRVLEERNAGRVNPEAGVDDYVHTAPTSPGDRAHFIATHPDTRDGIPSQYGTGAVLVDKESVANNHASNPDGTSAGKIRSVLVSDDAKLVDLEKPLPKEMVGQVLTELKKAGLEGMFDRAQIEGASGKEILDVLRELPGSAGEPRALDMVQERAKAEGFDGYQWIEGAENAAHNRKLLFGEEKFRTTEEYDPRPDAAPQIGAREAEELNRAARAPERSENYNPDVERQVSRLMEEVTSETLDATVKNQEAVARKLLTSPDAPAESVDRVSKIDEDFREDIRQKTWASELANCLFRGMT